jgi:hypothetical protein
MKTLALPTAVGDVSVSRCIEYRIIDEKRGAVVREGVACSEEELRIVQSLVDLVNKKYGMSFKVVAKM